MKKVFILLMVIFSFSTISYAGYYDDYPELDENREWSLELELGNMSSAKMGELDTGNRSVVGINLRMFTNEYFGFALGWQTGSGSDSVAVDGYEDTRTHRPVDAMYNNEVSLSSFNLMALARYPLASIMDIYIGAGIDISELKFEEEVSAVGYTSSLTSSDSAMTFGPVVEAGFKLYHNNWTVGFIARYIHLEDCDFNRKHASDTEDGRTLATKIKVKSGGAIYGFNIGFAF